MADAAEVAKERANVSLEEAVEASLQRLLPDLTVTYVGTIERNNPPADVRWEIEKTGGDGHVLRDASTTTARACVW